MIDALGEVRFVFGAIDRGIGGGIDDDIWGHAVQGGVECLRIGQIDGDRAIGAAARRHVQVAERRKRSRQLEADLTVCAEQQDLHQCAEGGRDTPICRSRKASIFSNIAVTCSSV